MQTVPSAQFHLRVRPRYLDPVMSTVTEYMSRIALRRWSRWFLSTYFILKSLTTSLNAMLQVGCVQRDRVRATGAYLYLARWLTSWY